MERPFAYVSAAWGTDEVEAREKAIKYCTRVYKAGYFPLCPVLMTEEIMNDNVPTEHRDKKAYGEQMLRRARILIVCGRADAQVKNDIALARRLHMAATTLRGVEEVGAKCPKEA